ncbi:hypothetical protein [Mycobacterium marinum]|uniref:hypothetical protein n=1 Tax=Mycobacterium marinum TaxID=1781 RepID=UPI003568F63A
MYYLIGVINGHWEIGEEIPPLMAESVKNFQRHGAGLILKDLSTIGKDIGELIRSIVDATVAQSEQASSSDASAGQTTSPAVNLSTESRPSKQ